MKVLVIDNEHQVLRVVARLVRSLGYVVVEADSLTQARDNFDDTVALVLTDLNLTGEDARDFYTEFKDRLEQPNGPGLVVMTGGATAAEISFFTDKGYTVLPKPVNKASVEPALKAAQKRSTRSP